MKSKLRQTVIIIGGIVLCIIGLVVCALGIPIIVSMKNFITNSNYFKLFISIIGLLFTAAYGLITFFIGLALLVPDKFIEDL